MNKVDKVEIYKIEVKDLFGFFNYELTTHELNNDIIVLYGDNGSGKTTILKSIFYLLSSNDRSGHKSALAGIKFRSIEVFLNNGISIGAIRNEQLIGSFTYFINSNNEKYELYLKATLDTDETGKYTINLSSDSQANDFLQNMYKFLQSLNLKIFYLSDSRKRMSTGISNIYYPEYNSEVQDELEFPVENFNNNIIMRRRSTEEENKQIVDTISLLEIWIKSYALKAAKVGEKKTNTIYLDIVNSIINTDLKIEDNISTINSDFLSLITEVNQRTKEYAIFGLISETEYAQMANAFNSASNPKKLIIYKVLEPFIRGIKAKLDAQKNLQLILSSFINQINTFLSDKTISYSLQNGFKISQKYTNEKLLFSNLSSGEQQLLLLFSSAILASSQATIFIIDEPEISLNVKWQRKLIDSLMNFGKIGGVQFILATHSIELLSNNKEKVIKLNNQKYIV